MQILSKQPSIAGPSEWFTGVVHFDVTGEALICAAGGRPAPVPVTPA